MHNPRTILCLLLLLAGCSTSINSERAFYQWLNDPDHGLMQVRETGAIRLTARYLPPEWMALRDARGTKAPVKSTYDSLLSQYRNSYTFLLTAEPGVKNSSTDIMYQGVSSYPEYKERVLQLNFHLESFIHLDTGREKLAPVLHTLENTYSATPGRTIYLVFSRTSYPAPDSGALDLVFTDDIFGSGIHHFAFDSRDLAGVPNLTPLMPNQ